jgi:hypothetical protein
MSWRSEKGRLVCRWCESENNGKYEPNWMRLEAKEQPEATTRPAGSSSPS